MALLFILPVSRHFVYLHTILSHSNPTRLLPSKMGVTVHKAYCKMGWTPVDDADGGRIKEDVKHGGQRSCKRATQQNFDGTYVRDENDRLLGMYVGQALDRCSDTCLHVGKALSLRWRLRRIGLPGA